MAGVLADETAIITGASCGIRQAIADRFAKAGADLVLCSRNEDDVSDVAEAVSTEHGVDATKGEMEARMSNPRG